MSRRQIKSALGGSPGLCLLSGQHQPVRFTREKNAVAL